MEASVKQVYNSYPPRYKEPLLRIRQMIYEIADGMPHVGRIEESLKWGQPTYATVSPKTGTPIRLDRFGEDGIAVFFHCQTNLIDRFKTLFADVLTFSGNRAIVLDPQVDLPANEIAACIEMALTYHLYKK